MRREAALTSENKKLQERIQYLNDQLEYRHLKGDFDPRQTKIIHLKYNPLRLNFLFAKLSFSIYRLMWFIRSNPTSEATQHYEDRLTTAKEEILKLRERIKAMEEGNCQDLTRIVDERVQSHSAKDVAGEITNHYVQFSGVSVLSR